MEFLRDKTKTAHHILSIPFIYGCAIWLFALDIFIEIYHRICFPLYGLEYVKRSNYFRFDRAKLPYLTPLQKFNCLYCSYGNGLMKYATQIVARTEQYWCGIQHKGDLDFEAPNHHGQFVEYGNEKAFKEKFLK